MKMTLDTAVDFLVEAIKEDYMTYTLSCAEARRRDAEEKSNTREFNPEGLSEVNLRMIAEFNENLSVRKGKKYIKIVQGGGVWGFIVAVDNDKQFRKGDILKAAGWAAPARNHARGNILDGDYSIQWTGPLYM